MTHHVLIAGTGRAGTTFLVQLLSACGLDGGLERLGQTLDREANAGLEVLPNTPGEIPYLVKSPWSHHVLEDAIVRCGRTIDHLIIPVRKLEDAAVSRVALELAAIHRAGVADPVWPPDSQWDTWGGATPGGVTYSLEPLDQARILAVALHRLVEVGVRFDIPMIFLEFPRVVEDGDYAFRKLAPVLGPDVGESRFSTAFAAIADPTKVRVGRDDGLSDLSGGVVGANALAKADVRALRMTVAGLQRDLAASQQDVAVSRQVAGDLAAAVDQVGALEELVRALEGRARAADTAESELERALEQQQELLAGALASRSWRITRPLRALEAIFSRR